MRRNTTGVVNTNVIAHNNSFNSPIDVDSCYFSEVSDAKITKAARPVESSVWKDFSWTPPNAFDTPVSSHLSDDQLVAALQHVEARVAPWIASV